ncbi:MAG: class I SAM-dependent methyltransferase [Clostridiales bacterium]|nr:class I SAM-dependent methyltransferase [Clostridiales bacterium]
MLFYINPGRWKDFFLNFADDIDAGVIVDTGCGTGLLTCALAEQGFKLIGVEPAKAMLEIAKKSLFSDRVEWINGLAKDLINYQADLVIMTGHVAQFHLTDEDWDEALDGIFRALKTGGYLVFESRNPNIHFWEPGKAQTSWQSSKENPHIINDRVYGEVRSWFEFISFEDNRLEYKLYYYFAEQNETVISHDILKFRTQKELSRSLQKKGFKINF